MSLMTPMVGIDLGTTNSEIAAFLDGQVQIIVHGDARMLPSCVGRTPGGDLLVGQAARNQSLVYPERTVSSVKRRMGTDEKVHLGDRTLSPQEVSALILRELAEWGQHRLGTPVKRAVITVPAYFSDVQRAATREAGVLAGLDVARILNEPTAASLAYGYGDEASQKVLIYDLGGGTFDISIVALEGDVTEVLASHGNNRLGGDDFDELLLERLVEAFSKRHGLDVREHPAALARLRWAAEKAKCQLSDKPHTMVREEALVQTDAGPLHLELEVSRSDYETLIRPLVDSTFDSVSKALDDASLDPGDLDAVLLVGGATRTPLVSALLEERMGQVPRREIDPDLCVALGAGILAARLSGQEVQQVLVDVSPYSFGPKHLGELYGRPYRHCYRPIIRRNTPLPVTRTESYYTAVPYQESVELEIFQGDDPDAAKNILVGKLRVSGLTPIVDGNEVLCRMSLDLDGILKVTAIEKRTGLSKQTTIEGALAKRSDLEIAADRAKLREVYASRKADLQAELEADPGAAPSVRIENGRDHHMARSEDTTEDTSGLPDSARAEAERVLARSRGLLESMHAEDREEAIELQATLGKALRSSAPAALAEATAQLEELLFFIEGR